MNLDKAKGQLVIIGGGEDKEGESKILKEFVRLAGGAKAKIVVLTVATDHPEELGKEYKQVFQRLGAKEAQVMDVSQRTDAHDEKALRLIEAATGVFFTGGDQLHVTALIGGSEMDRLLHERYIQGLIVGGTSAGAAMMSNSMMVDGPPEESPRLGDVRLGPGVEFVLGGVIDTHFSQRGRHGRLISTVAQFPHDLGIGIDENTAMIVKDGHFEVIGAGAVTVMDAGALTYTNVPEAEDGDCLALHNIRLHILPAGHKFDLHQRRPIVDQQPKAKNGQRATKGSAPARKSARANNSAAGQKPRGSKGAQRNRKATKS